MGSKKKEALTQFNRELILKAARKLFEEKGIEAARVDDIAREADCSKSTIYVYFQSKEDILNYILYEQMVMLKELIQSCSQKETDIEKCFYKICEELIKYREKYPVYFELMLGEIKVTPQDMKEENVLAGIYRVGEEINEVIRTILEKGMEAGYIRTDIAIIPTVLFLWSEISQTISLANKKQEYLEMRLQMKKEDYMQYGFDMILRSIRR